MIGTAAAAAAVLALSASAQQPDQSGVLAHAVYEEFKDLKWENVFADGPRLEPHAHAAGDAARNPFNDDPALRDQYSSASMTVITRMVTAGSVGSGEWYLRSR